MEFYVHVIVALKALINNAAKPHLMVAAQAASFGFYGNFVIAGMGLYG